MSTKYPHVFSPIKIGPIEIKNRFYASPHVNPLTVANGGPSDDYINYIVARVKGGCGLALVSLAALERSRFVLPSPHLKESIPQFSKLAKTIHDADGKIFGELWYWWGAGGQWGPLSPPAPGYSPSATQYNLFGMRSTTREMSKDEIRKQIVTFAESAANLRDAGFDGIMVHAAHGAMAEHFLSPYFNRRTDEYGGSLENRMRFLIEVLQAVRKTVGPRMAVGMRLNCDEVIEGGYHTKDSYQILKTIADMGLIDFADLDIAFEPDQYYLGMTPVFVEPGLYKPYVEAVRGAAGKVPVLSVLGRQTNLADGEQAIASGLCDMVGAARALIAEPNLVKNAREGNEDRSRTCIACNWCMASLYYDAAQSCTINPVAWREGTWGEIKPAPHKSKVVVVGGGPAGLEAARVAALRGHEVVLYEARDKLGGALLLWSQLPDRGFYKRGIDWWERELKLAGVKIKLGKPATAAAILAERPDSLIIATGALYCKQGQSNHRDVPIPGHDRAFVYRPEEFFLQNKRPTGKIVVLDGEGLHTGVGIAEVLANAGADVEILTPHLAPVSPRVTSTQDAPFIMKRMRTVGVKLSITTWAKAIGDHEITAYDVYSEKEHTIKGVDAVIMVSGRLPVNDLEKELDGKVPQIFTIGDALAVRIWATASYEGHKFARYIGEPNAPKSVADVYFSPEFS